MANWIFVTKNHPEYNLAARDIIEERRKSLFFGLSKMGSYQPGDKVIFYAGGEYVFIAEGEISRILPQLNEQEKEKHWLRNKYHHDFFHALRGVEFSYIKYFEKEVSVHQLENNLDFVREAPNLGLAFQGRNYEAISKSDFDKILNMAGGLKMEQEGLDQETEQDVNTEETSQEYRELCSEGRIEFITFHPSYSYEEFVEGITVETKGENVACDNPQYKLKSGIFKNLCKKSLAAAIGLSLEETEQQTWKQVYEQYCNKKNDIDFESSPRYVLIIDEINRGDIAKIFGELITLLEADKRIGAENELIVRLPNSNDYFGVPPNLYIIATMNTADRSIALLDVALRRRFGFLEMNPDFNVLSTEHIEKNKDLLKQNGVYELLLKSKDAIKKINQKICGDKAIGRDRQIGHSFLFKIFTIDDLVMVWRHEILPLLEEYCYSDYRKINRILFNKDSDTEWISEAEGIRNISDIDKMLSAIE